MRNANKLVLYLSYALTAGQMGNADQVSFDPSLIAEGSALYLENCAICHGNDGDGKGPLASGFTPAPRDFTRGSFKFRSTKFGEYPAESDLTKIIQSGITGSYGPTMPAFDFFDERQLTALTEVVRYLAGIEEFGTPFSPPARPRRTDPAKGQAIYNELRCGTCHGDRGDGQGELAAGLKDEDGNPIRPANFQVGQFKGGNEPEDIWLRIYGGVAGTPMPAFGRNTTEADIWAVTEYIIAFNKEE